MMPAKLRQVGYRPHQVGKWHLGSQSPWMTPVGRGFETSLGPLRPFFFPISISSKGFALRITALFSYTWIYDHLGFENRYKGTLVFGYPV